MKKLLYTACLLLLTAASLHSQRINDLTGINAHPNDPPDLQKRFSWVRLWHDWSNDVPYAAGCQATCPDVNLSAQSQFQWNPSLNNQTGPKLNYDTYYGSLGKKAIPVLKGIDPRMRGHHVYPTCYTSGIKPLEQKPFCLDTSNWCNPDPSQCGIPALTDLPAPTTTQEQPETYAQHALWVSLFAAKFGQADYPQNYVQPYVNEPAAIIGRDVIQYLENNNEPNKSWYDNASPTDFLNGNTRWYFSPDQFGAMLRADYDGKFNTMTAGAQTLGINNASAGVQFVMGGLAGLHGKYFKDMINGPNTPSANWVANFHHYSTNKTAMQNLPGQFFNTSSGEYNIYSQFGLFFDAAGSGVSPEADSLRSKLKWLRFGGPGQNQAGLGTFPEYWFSEFGYDSFKAGSTESSSVNAPALTGGDGTYDSQKVQAQWLVRGVLEAAWSKAMDKMMLYELRDHPDSANTYSYSGLLTNSGVAKRSWFYIMTLKHILGEHKYEKEIKHNVAVPNTLEKFKVVANSSPIRVYEFKKDGDLIYAIWSPTQTAKTPFTCAITFPTVNNSSSGGPNYILTNGATLYRIQEMNEKGQRTNWSQYVSGQTISNIPVSETPVFLRINQSLPTQAVPQHVTGLAANSACCNSVELTWNSPVTRNSLVFYREKTTPACPAFDFTECTLFTQTIGSRHNLTVTGLESGKTYCFYVIPVNLYGNTPVDPQNAPSATATVNGCSNCLINIQPSELSYDTHWTSQPAYTDLQTQVKKILSVEEGSQVTNSCDDITVCSYTDGLAWTTWISASTALPEPNTFFVNFITPKLLKSIYAQDWSGNGDVLIQYKDCNCDKWQNLTTLRLEGTDPCPNVNGIGKAQVLSHSMVPNKPIRALKVTKLHSDAVLRRLYFCGTDAICVYPPRVPGLVSNLLPDEIRYNSATLRWTVAKDNALDSLSDQVDRYELSLSEQLNGNNELVNPVVFDVEASPYERDVMHRLASLAPATVYYADVRVKPETVPCPPVPVTPGFQRVMFTTETKGVNDRSASSENLPTRTSNPYVMYLTPNPAGQEVTVRISAGELERVLVMDVNGRVMKEMKTAPVAAVLLDVKELPTGTYWVRTIRTDRVPLTALLVKN